MGLGGIISTIAIAAISAAGQQVPHSLIATASFCYGSLANLMVLPTLRNGTTPVTPTPITSPEKTLPTVPHA